MYYISNDVYHMYDNITDTMPYNTSYVYTATFQ